MIKIGILGSTNGSDVVPIAEAILSGELDASIEVIITNNRRARILDKAKKYGVDFSIINIKTSTEKSLTNKSVKSWLKKK